MNQDSSANVRLPTAKLARRRALLAGLGKGSALIAAASPLQALATGRIVAPNGGQCTLSGNGSILVSHTANSVATPCGMVGPSAYVKVTPDLAKDATQLSGIAESTLNGLSLNGVYPWLGASNSLRLVVKTNSLTGNNARFALVEWLIAPPGIVPPTATFTDALGAGSGLVHESLLYGLYAGTRPVPAVRHPKPPSSRRPIWALAKQRLRASSRCRSIGAMSARHGGVLIGRLPLCFS